MTIMYGGCPANPFAVACLVVVLVTLPICIFDPTVNVASMYSAAVPFHPLGTRVPRMTVIGSMFGLCSLNLSNADSIPDTVVFVDPEGFGSRPVIAALIAW